MKKYKASGLSELVAEVIQATGDIWIQWILDLYNGILKKRMHSKGLRVKCSTTNLPRQRWLYGVCILQRDQIAGTYCESGKKYLWAHHSAADWDRQYGFGFMKCKGTTDAILLARQMQENFRVKCKKLYFGFVEEKAFDRVPWEVISWAVRKSWELKNG